MQLKDISYDRSKVTIGVCVRNLEGLISDTIESITSQDFPHEFMEVIFVDDGSVDETLSVIENYVPKMDIFTRVFHHKWRGLGFSRNVVVRNARGKYVIWVDGDMQLSKDFVKKQMEFMEANPSVGIAKGKYGIYSANLVSELENLEFVATNLRRCEKGNSGPLGTGGSIYRVNAIKQVGGFDENITGSGEDADAEHRIRLAGWLLDTVDAVFYEIRRETWRSLWNEYFWHGRGGSHFFKGNTWYDKPYKLFPLVIFSNALSRVETAYKLSGEKKAFLMPLHYLFKRTAWILGFASGLLMSRKSNVQST